MDYAGDSLWRGPKNRTAWAEDDGVLFHDTGGDGQITEGREFVFTEWDPTARDDTTALRGRGEASELGRLRRRIHLTSRSG